MRQQFGEFPANRMAGFRRKRTARRKNRNPGVVLRPHGCALVCLRHFHDVNADQVRQRVRAELLHHLRAMLLNGALSDAEYLRGLLVGLTGNDEIHDFAFSVRQRIERGPRQRRMRSVIGGVALLSYDNAYGLLLTIGRPFGVPPGVTTAAGQRSGNRIVPRRSRWFATTGAVCPKLFAHPFHPLGMASEDSCSAEFVAARAAVRRRLSVLLRRWHAADQASCRITPRTHQ